ncbi:hypothetical protein BJ138DRAFT_1112709 [Hygrophoropsis aurantiaca]|uniref:Uncharacterized protein n=1 Tax=Hygrophoropsis aurantiaca TaxID=72124 RepID=A0ACB8AGL6_9AGAM|nr:hypothetical protein BJ138DRAFT_1112709 [Hygrophoropsis aurantiaca]
MGTYNDWTDLLPFFSGFINGSITIQAEDDNMQSTASSVVPPVSPQPTPVFGIFTLQSDALSQDSLESLESLDATFFVSTAFPADSADSTHPTDTVLLSSDSVFFYVHRSVLQVASDHAFQPAISTSSPSDISRDHMTAVSESATVLNIVLHTIYGRSCLSYTPSFEDLAAAVSALVDNDISLEEYISSETPLGIHILTYAPRRALEIYILAGHYRLNDLAVTASCHLLSCNLSSITDEMAVNMGPIYLRRLFTLHTERLESLKRILMPPPHPHPATSTCKYGEQSKVVRAWTLATAYLIWDSRVDLSVNNIRSVITPMEEQLKCPLCREILRSRTNTLVVQWNSIKGTI